MLVTVLLWYCAGSGALSGHVSQVDILFPHSKLEINPIFAEDDFCH